MAYNQLTLQERYYIEIEMKNGTSQKKIAKECDVYLTHPKLQEMSTFSFKDIKKAYALGRETALNFLETKH